MDSGEGEVVFSDYDLVPPLGLVPFLDFGRVAELLGMSVFFGFLSARVLAVLLFF